MIDEQGEERVGERKRERVNSWPVVLSWYRTEAREEVYIEIVFVSVKGEGRFVGVLRRTKRGCNDASDELKLVKGGLMRVNRVHEEKNDLSLYFNGFVV